MRGHISTIEKLYKVIEERQLVSYSNDTRWKRLTNRLNGQLFRSRIKWIFAQSPTSWGTWILPTDDYLEHSNLGPLPFREIEWLEIDSLERQFRGRLIWDKEIDRSVEVASILTKCQVAFTQSANIYRIWGYCGSTIAHPLNEQY